MSMLWWTIADLDFSRHLIFTLLLHHLERLLSLVYQTRYRSYNISKPLTTSPYIPPSPRQTKKVVLRLECTSCKGKHQLVLKRCKHFELGGDKKQRGAAISF